MTQLSMLEVLDATLDAHFPLALPKARPLAQAREGRADVEAPVYLSDSERYDREPRTDYQTGYYDE